MLCPVSDELQEPWLRCQRPWPLPKLLSIVKLPSPFSNVSWKMMSSVRNEKHAPPLSLLVELPRASVAVTEKKYLVAFVRPVSLAEGFVAREVELACWLS